jgi:histidinol-phosphate phosphatase family protein
MNSRRAVFVDKDGTLIHNVPYNVDPDLVRLTPCALEGLSALRSAGFAIVVVSNQPGVAHGFFPASALQDVERRLSDLLGAAGVPLLGFYFCPHAIGSCTCRKPAPGMLEDAAREHGLDLPASWMVGDVLDDVEAGRSAGCRTVLLDTGGETEWMLSPARMPHATASDLLQAAAIILAFESTTAGLSKAVQGSG